MISLSHTASYGGRREWRQWSSDTLPLKFPEGRTVICCPKHHMPPKSRAWSMMSGPIIQLSMVYMYIVLTIARASSFSLSLSLSPATTSSPVLRRPLINMWVSLPMTELVNFDLNPGRACLSYRHCDSACIHDEEHRTKSLFYKNFLL